MSEMKCSRFTDIEELATSSLLGLLVTIKEHITKPTAMAQGRVAHLIEWKDWGTGGEGVGRGRDWRNLQEDEKMYSHLSDEIKEARFAAGVAEQFALAEAAMNIWPKYEDPEQPSTGIDLLQDSHVLCDFMLDGGSAGLPQHLYNVYTQDPNNIYTQDNNNVYTQDPNNIYTQDINNIYTQDTNNVYTQDTNNIYTQDLNNIYTQDINNVYTQDIKNVYTQDIKNVYTQDNNNIYTQDTNNVYTQDINNVYTQDPNNIYTQDNKNVYTQDIKNVYTQDIKNVYTQDNNNVYTQDINNVYTQDPNNIYTQDNKNIYTQDNNNYHTATPGPPGQPGPSHTTSSVSPLSSSHPDSDQQHSENGRNIEVSSMFWHVDSSSLSEDEVFYDYGKDKRPRRDIW